MNLLELTKEYQTDIDSIDYEHQKLVNYINAIIEARDQGEGARLLIEINLDELIGYTVFHFNHEEKLLQEHNDPTYESHKKAHDNLKAKVLDFKKRFSNNEDIADELIVFLKDWLLVHIKGVDTLYIDNFKSKGVK